MKKKIVVLITFLSIVSCSNNAIVLEGFLHKDSKLDSIALNKRSLTLDKVPINKENTFNFKLDSLNKGYYKLNETIVYLTPGKNLKAIFSSDSINFKGNGAKENIALQDIEKRRLEFSKTIKEQYYLDLEAFQLKLNEYTTWISSYLENKELDEDFKHLEKRKSEQLIKSYLPTYAFRHGVDFTLLSKALDYLDPKNPQKMKVFDSLRNKASENGLSILEKQKLQSKALKDFQWNDEALFLSNSLGYEELLKNKIKTSGSLLMSKAYEETKDRKSVPRSMIFERNTILDSIENKTIRDYFLKSHTLSIIKVHSDYADEAYEIYKKSNPSKLNLEDINSVYNNLKRTTKGSPSPKFVDYKTPNDESINLNDFLGKYVYIDVWATWCGPCKKEIPFLQKVEKKYHGKNIAFVSISVDVEKQRQKWKDMVADMNLTGTQIMADKDFKSDFITAYNIAAIPRFILIDPQGKIVSSEAPRPSSTELIELFNHLEI